MSTQLPTDNNDEIKKNNLSSKYFKLIAGLALVWNLMGVMAFIGQMFTTPEMIAEMPQAEQNLYNSTPMWAIVAFAFAVFGGALGCVALLMKKALAEKLLLSSLLGVLVQMFHSFFISNAFEVYGLGGTIMPIMVVAIAIALLIWAKRLRANYILR